MFDEHPGNHQPLLHPLGELGDSIITPVDEIHSIEQTVGVEIGDTEEASEEHEVLSRRHVRVEVLLFFERDPHAPLDLRCLGRQTQCS